MKEIKEFIQELYDSATSGYTGMLVPLDAATRIVSEAFAAGMNFQDHEIKSKHKFRRFEKSDINKVVEYLRRFPYVPSQLKISDVLRNIVGKQLNVRATYDTLMRNEWIIAAPVDTMTNNTTIELYSEYSEMKKRIIEDPIIFKASKIGAVIVTMWDKEAEDSMFDKYR